MIIFFSTVALQTLREDIGAVRIGLKKVVDELDIFANSREDATHPMNRDYISRMNSFVDQAKKKFTVLDEEMEDMMKQFKQMAQKFGEDAEVLKWEEFFAMLTAFNDSFEKVRSDIEKDKQQDLRKLAKSNPMRVNRARVTRAAVDNKLQEQRDPQAIEKRQSLRRAKSIRRVNNEDPKKNLNNLLDMLDKMKKTEKPGDGQPQS
jgi:hypothetical protein